LPEPGVGQRNTAAFGSGKVACSFGYILRIVRPAHLFILSILLILSDLFFILTGFTGFCRIFILFSSFLMKEEKPNPLRGKL